MASSNLARAVEERQKEIEKSSYASRTKPQFNENSDIAKKVEQLISNKKKSEKKFNNNPPKKEVPKANTLADGVVEKGRANEYLHTSVINESIEVGS